MKSTNQNNRTRKEAALSRLFQGDSQAVRELRPKMTLDLDQFTGEELDQLRMLCPVDESTNMMKIDLPAMERVFGRSLHLIPQTPQLTF